MIEKIGIRKFQRHEKLNITFTPYVNSIVGATDAGKSAIIRALRWVVFNRPKGDAFTKDQKGKAKVFLKIDGKVIKREKGKQNLYTLGNKEFKAFNNDVPPEISKVINLDQVNFQAQFDPHFWFCETPGEVSRQLNKIIDLSIIDSTLANLASFVREARMKIKVGQDSEVKAKEKVEELNFIQDMDKGYKNIENIMVEVGGLEIKREALFILFEDITVYKNTIKKNRKRIKTGKVVLLAKENLTKTRNEHTGLNNLVCDYEEYQEKAEKKIPSITKLERLNNTVNKAQDKRANLTMLLLIVDNTEKELQTKRKKLREAKKALTKWDGKVCEVCGQKIKIK